MEGTLKWKYYLLDCPQTMVQLSSKLMKVYTNQTIVQEGSMTVLEHKDKYWASQLELAESFILCVYQPTKHI
jgi:hypothetical protein